jgi:transcriptional regulator of heat shock response
VIEMMIEERLCRQLNVEADKLIKEYAILMSELSKPKLFETPNEKDEREAQLRKDKEAKWEEFDCIARTDFEKKRDYVIKLKDEIEETKLTERKNELEQKLKDQNITEKGLLELQALNNLLQAKT